MELVEGPTLADRIAQGPIPIDEALPIAKQIAEALEAAHEQGIIHRDLETANTPRRIPQPLSTRHPQSSEATGRRPTLYDKETSLTDTSEQRDECCRARPVAVRAPVSGCSGDARLGVGRRMLAPRARHSR